MNEIKKKVADLLKKYGMHHEDINIEEVSDIFLEEMQKGLAGEDSSLRMLPTYIETDKEVPINEPVIVIDAGGTNFRVATVHFDEDRKPIVQNLKPAPDPMPGAQGEVGKTEFFEIMAGYMEKVIDISDRIGFCFSYPTETFPNKDGKLIRFSKEIKASEVEGQMIGENLNIALKASGVKEEKRIVILNDTVTTLLAGVCSFPDRVFDSFIGFILGTGTNTCYIEQNKNITKTGNLDPKSSMVINIESCGFSKAPRGKIDIEFDNTTKNPGLHTFEKMLSGAYLGPLCLMVVQTAAQKGFFSPVTAEQLANINELTTKDVSDFLSNPAASNNPFSAAIENNDNADLATLLSLLERLVERAAKLTAINLSSAVLKSGKGQAPSKPVCIVAEGTTFYRLKGLKSKVEYYLKEYLQKKEKRYYEIISVDNATLIGAAIAGLTN